MNPIIDRIEAAQDHAAAVRPRVGGFPYLAEALRSAGVTHCFFDVPSQTFRYVTAEGDVLEPGALLVTEKTPVPVFDRAALVDALRADQRGLTGFSGFVENCWRAGVIAYEIDTAERTCSYLGARGERYVERYPAVDLPTSRPTPEGRLDPAAAA